MPPFQGVTKYTTSSTHGKPAAGMLTIGFDRLGLPGVGSWTLPGNRASQRVMEKLGFRYETNFVFKGLEHRYYRLKREWYTASVD
ncbi:MAG: GNAT family N-acetyltransferase [Planctomycetes bacterium]|nr:GNAT family N-acetyltransferase [Planctomycetota bacterium]